MRDQIRDKDDLDLLLDSALSTYADPGPGSGLEDRVLAAVARARAETPTRIVPRNRRWLPWAIAIPVAAGLILLWLLAPTRVEHTPMQPQQARDAQPAPPTPPVVLAAGLGPKSSPHVHRSPRAAQPASPARPALSAALPKLGVFPTPQTLTAEERALVLAGQAPEPVRAALVEAQNQNDAPIHIAAIRIPPLESNSTNQP